MKESVWGYAVVVLGIISIMIIWFFANVTRTDQHNFNLLKETVEAAMLDSVDLSAYRDDGTIRIIEQKFVSNFLRRFAENADLTEDEYKIEIFDVYETPPKVSIRVTTPKSKTFWMPNNTDETFTIDMVNNIDAILETKWFVNGNYKEDVWIEGSSGSLGSFSGTTGGSSGSSGSSSGTTGGSSGSSGSSSGTTGGSSGSEPSTNSGYGS